MIHTWCTSKEFTPWIGRIGLELSTLTFTITSFRLPVSTLVRAFRLIKNLDGYNFFSEQLGFKHTNNVSVFLVLPMPN